ncbi:MAG: MFS transporter [Pseudomonadota bacterium]
MSLTEAETRYQTSVHQHLRRNFLIVLVHGLFGQTGFRLINAPTFMPAYIMLLSGGSDLAVGIALSLQSIGMCLTPLISANLIEHRPRVLFVNFFTGGGMRLMVLGLGLAGLLLPPHLALYAIFFFLLMFGLFNGMQSVIFSYLMSKIIPVERRGRLTGLRNFLAGLTAASVAYFSGHFFLGEQPDASGYSYTFILAFALTMIGLTMTMFIKEPVPPSVRTRTGLMTRVKEIPALLRSDMNFTWFFLARSMTMLGRMAVPFYILFAGQSIGLTGETLGIITVIFALSGTSSNLFWGWLADQRGFRLTALCSLSLWIVSTLLLMQSDNLVMIAFVFAGLGAALQGFMQASHNLTLEFGQHDDLPMRIAIANTASELAGALGPILGGILAMIYGYTVVFYISMLCFLIGGLVLIIRVPEPRYIRRN